MSYKLVDKIKKSTLPGKYKRVLEAWASFGNKDGTGIRPSKEAVARRAGVNRRTVYRHTDDLVKAGILVVDVDQKGEERRHYYGNGHYTTLFHLDAEALSQNVAFVKPEQCDILTHGQCDILSKSDVSECHATIPLGKL